MIVPRKVSNDLLLNDQMRKRGSKAEMRLNQGNKE